MTKVAALLAAVLAIAVGGCGGSGDGAEPGGLAKATLILDFVPNAVHAGLYAAVRDGTYRDRGVDLTIRRPSASTDAPKLLRAGRAQFAVLDIHDLGLARQAGIDIVGIVALVQRPLAAVLSVDPGRVRRPRDLEGRRAGVTGLPSDDAVLESVVSADGGDPSRVRKVTIGFEAVKALAAGRVAAATAFWNVEGIELTRRGVGHRTFRVDRYGAPPYPELVLATSAKLLRTHPRLVRAVAEATAAGIHEVAADPQRGIRSLLAANPDLDRSVMRAQMNELRPILEPAGRLDRGVLDRWARWDLEHGILKHRLDVGAAFAPGGSP